MILESSLKQFSVPAEAVLKTDLLRQGIHFTKEALQALTSSKAKSYFIFSFDRVTQKEMSEREKKAIPEEIALTGGPWNLKRTIVSVRFNPQSPYSVRLSEENCFELVAENEILAMVTPPPQPAYYNEPLPNGKPVQDIAPTIEWGYLIYLTAFRLCQYWGEKEECGFCDINENYRQQKKERSYTGIKSIEETIQAMTLIDQKDSERVSHAYTVTGGA
ncbi:MAG: radical SAM protein, partial [bacterium]|nr:radical SAM protein [bacterium]